MTVTRPVIHGVMSPVTSSPMKGVALVNGYLYLDGSPIYLGGYPIYLGGAS